jgi:DNA mismatch endonuclease (patch repair protein)
MQPVPLDHSVRTRLRAQGRRDTKPELLLRSELHRRGLRFRVDRSPVKGVRSRADLVFGPSRVAVFVDGCFWHSCPQHGTIPKNNRGWWTEKLQVNGERDRRAGRTLAEAGWLVIRVWEHDDVVVAADRIERAVRTRRACGGGSSDQSGTEEARPRTERPAT